MLDQSGQLTSADAERLKKVELENAAMAEGARVGLPFVYPENWSEFSGTYSRHIEFAQGRFAVITGRDRYTLVPASARNSIWLGREVTLNRSRTSIQWSLGRSITLEI